ncbi:MAG: glycosyltransferase family 4 protein [Methanobacteriaceae archaeon]
MKIAFIYDVAYPWVTGGVEMRIYEMAKRLVSRGHDVHWYTLGWWWDENNQNDLVMDGIIFHGVSKPVPIYSGSRRSIKEAIYFALRLLRPLLKERFDVVDCQGFPFFSCYTAWFHSLLGRSRLIITLHEVWGDYWYHYLGRVGIMGKAVEKVMVHLTDNLITVSAKTYRDLQKLRKVDARMIPNGLDFERIQRLQSSPPDTELIFAGRLISEKGVDLLIRSLPLVKKIRPDLKCSITGDGPERDNLEKLTAKLNLEGTVKFTGFLKDHDELLKIMKSSEVLVLPSKREGFGMVVLEANACGLPAVVVNHPMNAAVELIKNDENGFIVEASETALAEGIITGLKRKNSMQEACIEFARGYDWDQIVLNLEDFYQEVINPV